MFSAVMGNGTAADVVDRKSSLSLLQRSQPTSTATANTANTVTGPSLKRKLSHSEEAVASVKLVKFSHPASEATNGNNTSTSTTTSTKATGGGKIATNTIMITNSYSKSGLPPTTTTASSNSSQITILAKHSANDDDTDAEPRPMVVDQINICINNHFSSDALLSTTTTASATDRIDIRAQTGKPGYEEAVDIEEQMPGFTIKKEPRDEEEAEVEKKNSNAEDEKKLKEALDENNKTKQKSFSIGEEVLVPRQSLEDGDCFYLGILTVLRGDQCLVQFDDGSNCWASVNEIKRLLRPTNTAYCVICKVRELRRDAEAEHKSVHDDCGQCGRVYHRACLQRELKALQDEDAALKVKEETNCLRCFKRDAGLDLEAVRRRECARANDAATVYKSQGVIQSNSSNTGNSTTNSVLNHHQVEIGAPSMDWFTKEANGRNTDDLCTEEPANGHADDGDSLAKDEDEEEPEQSFYTDANGRRLRKRNQKRNYKDIQRTLTSQSSSSSWSCASSTTSSTSSSNTAANSSSSGVIAPFISNAQPLFTLEELRWAFLPKSHKSFRGRGSKKEGKRGAAVKVPYSGEDKSSSAASSRTSSRRASREVQSTTNSTSALAANAATGAEYTRAKSEAEKAAAEEETRARLERGESYVVKGRRRDAQGNVQYLIEWATTVKQEVKEEQEDGEEGEGESGIC